MAAFVSLWCVRNLLVTFALVRSNPPPYVPTVTFRFASILDTSEAPGDSAQGHAKRAVNEVGYVE
jgi:hypothetical protein